MWAFSCWKSNHMFGLPFEWLLLWLFDCFSLKGRKIQRERHRQQKEKPLILWFTSQLSAMPWLGWSHSEGLETQSIFPIVVVKTWLLEPSLLHARVCVSRKQESGAAASRPTRFSEVGHRHHCHAECPPSRSYACKWKICLNKNSFPTWVEIFYGLNTQDCHQGT